MWYFLLVVSDLLFGSRFYRPQLNLLSLESDSLNLPWYLRGPLVAFIIGLCVTYFDYFMGYGWTLTIVVNFMSISYGFMIDGILTHFFKGETN